MIQEEGVDGGTQTSPAVGHLEKTPGILEAECQVTPGLGASRKSGDRSLPVGQTNSSQGPSSRNHTVAGFSISTEESLEKADKRRSEVTEIINSLADNRTAEDLMDSLAEEVNIDLKENE